MELAYTPTIGAMRLLMAALGLRITLDGAEHIPTSGPVVIASNHVSYLDFAFVGLAGRKRSRYVRFLARYDVWNNPVVGPFMRGMRHIPVSRRAPAGAYLSARAALVRGEAVGIFPEAGVSKSYTVRPMMPGAVALARETGASIVPLVVWGGQRIYTAKPALTGNQLHLRWGTPIAIRAGAPISLGAEADVVEETRSLRRLLQGMLIDVQRSHPDQPKAGAPAPWHPVALGGSAPTPEQASAVDNYPLGAIDA